MGLFKKAKEAAQGAAGAQGAATGGGGLSGMMGGMGSMANMQMPDPVHVALVNRIGKTGVEAPATITAMRAVGSPDMSGATLHEFDVDVTASGLDAYKTTIKQSMLPMQMSGLAEGKAVTIKYDPQDPSQALLTSW